MSDQDERDLAAPFERLTAPRSTAAYAGRTRSLEVAESPIGRRWPQAIASVLAVLVAVAGAGTFLALRSSRQNEVATGGGYPAARAGAAIAFDSTAGVTVMFGGMSTSGRQLSDTWAWNGTSWGSAAGGSPGPMAVARISDDPADGGVLLLGLPAQNGPPVACAVAGSAGGGTAAGLPPTTAPAPPPGVAQPPAVAPIPSGAPITACALPAAPPPSVQTWLFTATGWIRLASSLLAATDGNTPTPGSELAYDAATGEVVAVTAGGIPPCGPPLLRVPVAAEAPGLACPLADSSGSANSSSGGAALPACAPSAATCTAPGCAPAACAPAIACRVLTAPRACPSGGTLSTWTWSHGRWTQRRGGIVPSAWAGAVVFGDPVNGHATLVTQTVEVPIVRSCVVACPGANVYPMTRSWSWGGAGWTLATDSGGGSQPAPSLAGATVASASGRAVVLTAAGELWTWTSATPQWSRQTAAQQPDSREAAALGAGPNGTVVLFGGVRLAAGNEVVLGLYPPGADTWTWDGSAWKHVAGTLPTPLPAPTGCPGAAAANLVCPYPGPPTIIPPATPTTASPTPVVAPPPPKPLPTLP